MIDHLPTMQKLLRQLYQVPYLSSKNMYRVAHFLLEMEEQKFEQFLDTVKLAHEGLKKCTICWGWKELHDICQWCSNQRDQTIICVVETWHDLCAIEQTNAFPGTYHILGGVICPLEGKRGIDLTIESLISRLNQCTELIFALSQTPEGEATATYIVHQLRTMNKEIKITCLSRGVPVGSSLTTLDRVTLFKALSERRLF